MAAQELGGRVNNDIGAMLDRPAQIGRCHGVVDHQRHAGLMRNRGHLFDIQNVHARIGDGLAIDRARLRRDRFAEILRIVGLHEFHVDSQAAEAHVELRVRAAVERARRDNLIAQAGQAGERQELRRLSAGRRQRRHAAFERRHALLEHVGGRVHDAAIDIAELLQREQAAACAEFSKMKEVV